MVHIANHPGMNKRAVGATVLRCQYCPLIANLPRLWTGRTMAQAVSRRTLSAEARVRARSAHVGFAVNKVALGQVFLQVLRLFLVNNDLPWLSILIYHLEQWFSQIFFLWPHLRPP
jgi:hypothetical protein